jgi:dTDP-4-amino-4,6-dideoxygalactose transaminase
MNPYDAENSMPNFWLSCMLIRPEGMCGQTLLETSASYEKEPGKSCPTEILEKLAAHNVEGRPIWKPMHMQPIYRDNVFVAREGNGEDVRLNNVGLDIFLRGLCLPSDIKMTEQEQLAIIDIIRSCFA